MQSKMKQEEVEKELDIFFLKCQKRHPQNKCPLSNIKISALFEEQHPTNKCPSFPGLKDVYQ